MNLHAYDHAIYRLDADYIHPELAAVYLLVEADEVAIIETATSYTVPLILKALKQLKLKPENIKYIIPTHIHLDHAGGCGALLKYCSNATVLVHPRGIRHLINPSKLIAGATSVYGKEEFKDLYGEITPIDPRFIKQQEDNSSVFMGERELCFLHTEGHAKHHFCIHDKKSNSIFAGDSFGISYPALNALSTKNKNYLVIPTTTPIHFDPDAMKKSFVRLVSLSPSTIYLTHFGPVDTVSSAYLQLLFWVSFYEGLVHTAIESNHCSEEYFYQQLLQTNQDIFLKSHDLSAQQIEEYLSFDLRLNAQGLMHYSQTL